MAHAAATQPITVGVDTHLDSHVAHANDQLGRRVGTRSVPTTPTGYQDLLAWARGLGQPIAWGVEGTGSYGAALARFLAANGQVVVEVNRPDRQARRRRGKSDPLDAEAAARAVQAGQATVVRRDTRAKSPVPLDGAARAARELLEELQRALHGESLAYREAHTYPVTDLGELRERLPGGGFFRVAWCGSPACEQAIGEGTGATIRALVGGDPPAATCVVDGAPTTQAVLVARAY